MKKFDRFDFEQQIMNCWNVTSDIRTVTEYLLDAPLEDGREDKIANMLMGIEALYNAKFDKLFSQFEDLVHEHARHLDRDYKAVDEFNAEQIRKFHEAQQELQDMITKDLDVRAKAHERANPLAGVEDIAGLTEQLKKYHGAQQGLLL